MNSEHEKMFPKVMQADFLGYSNAELIKNVLWIVMKILLMFTKSRDEY